MNFSDDSFAGDDQFSISDSLDSYEIFDNRDDYLRLDDNSDSTVSQSDQAWGFCSSEESLYISNDIAQSDPELAAKLTREANSTSWGNEATPESSRARLEAKADELFKGRVTIMTSGYCGTVSIRCHECCDYYRLKNATLLAGSSACRCTSDRNVPLPAHETFDFVYPSRGYANWITVKREVKQQQADERERKRRQATERGAFLASPVNRLEKWTDSGWGLVPKETTTTFEQCHCGQFFDTYLKSHLPEGCCPRCADCKDNYPCGDEA